MAPAKEPPSAAGTGDAMGTLYLVGTPIGNLEDVTLRALRVLREVHCVAAEDTRQTRKLLHHYDIHTPVSSYHSHNEERQAPVLLQRLRAGEAVALVSDAGMPGISDPGAHLVALCVDQGVPVVPVPGPTAAVTALVVSGLPTGAFAFEGFLPRAGSRRRNALQRLAAEPRTWVIYEAPHRLVRTLAELSELLGERQVAVGRELTKRFEEVVRGTPATLLAHFTANSPRGEITLVVAGAGPPDHTPRSSRSTAGAATMSRETGPPLFSTGGGLDPGGLASAMAELEAEGLARKEAMRVLAQRLGVGRRAVYQALLALPLPTGEPEGDS